MGGKFQSGWAIVNEVRAMKETVYGVKAHYVHAGEGEPIVLVHGAGPGANGEAAWSNTIPVLAERFHVYAIDCIGYGLSDKPAIDYSFQTSTNFVAGFVDALNLQHVRMMGNSQGAYIAMKYVLDNPSRVKSAALISTGTLATAMGIESRGRATPLPRFTGTKETLRAFLEVIVNDPTKLTDELVNSRYELAMLPGAQEMRESMSRYQKLVQEDPNERQVFDVQDRLPKLTIPWCMIWGGDDRSAPLDPLGNGLHAKLPHVPFYVVDGSGHQVQNDKPEECNNLLFEWFTASGH